MQNAKCKMQNAKCKMQNAKCKMLAIILSTIFTNQIYALTGEQNNPFKINIESGNTVGGLKATATSINSSAFGENSFALGENNISIGNQNVSVGNQISKEETQK